MRLNDTMIRNTKPAAKPLKLFDRTGTRKAHAVVDLPQGALGMYRGH